MSSAHLMNGIRPAPQTQQPKEKEMKKRSKGHAVHALPVELPTLDSDAVLRDSHAEILHRQHSAALA